MQAPTDDDDLPTWYQSAMCSPVECGTISVDGADVAYRAWGERGGDGIVLVHGGAAHARWWDHVGPFLAGRQRVVALDLSGHGDSGRRPHYSLDLWARETLEVAVHAGIAGTPTLIGHSLGGYVTLQAAMVFGSAITGVVVIDSPVRDTTPEEQAAFEQRAFGPLRIYPSRAAAIARFRPVPEQADLLRYVVAHVAATSICEVDGGWTWKFDPAIFTRTSLSPAFLTRLDCRVALFRAEHGSLSQQMSDVMYDRLGRAAPVIEIPAAGHHVMLDQPLALVTGIRTLLSDWDHSLPSATPDTRP